MVCIGFGLLWLASAASWIEPWPANAAPEHRCTERAIAEAAVRADLAWRTSAPPESIRVVATAERTWPDERLGCLSRGAVADPIPAPGFRIVLAHGERRYVYHADREGRFVPCDRPPKPIDPIR